MVLQAGVLLGSKSVRCYAAISGKNVPNVLYAVGIVKHLIHLFQRLSGRLREHEVDVDGHGSTEDCEDDVSPPGDVCERRLR